jgi:hypothetical protein
MSWSLYQREFLKLPGSLRDIYINDTTIGDWRSLWAWLISSGFRLSYSVDGEHKDLPEDPQDALALRKTAATLLSINVGEIRVNCHFFSTGTIEFDIDPRQVASDETLDALCRISLGAEQRIAKANRPHRRRRA